MPPNDFTITLGISAAPKILITNTKGRTHKSGGHKSADSERRNIDKNFRSVMKLYCPHTKRSTAGCIGLKYTADGFNSTIRRKKMEVSEGLKTLFTLLVFIAIRLTAVAMIKSTPHIPLSQWLSPKSQTSPLPATGIRKEVTASTATRQESTFIQNEYFPRTG